MIQGHVEVGRGLEGVVQSDNERMVNFLQDICFSNRVFQLLFGNQSLFAQHFESILSSVSFFTSEVDLSESSIA